MSLAQIAHNPRHIPAPMDTELALNLSSSLFGKDSAFSVESFDQESKYSLGAFRDGIWERRLADIGHFTYLKTKIDLLGLNNRGCFDFQFSLPKIPVGFFYAIKDFFTIVCEKWDDEVMVQVFWKKSEERYYIFVPEQRV